MANLKRQAPPPAPATRAATRRPSSLLDTRVIYCGDNLEQLPKLPDHCIDLIYIDPPFNSNRNYEVFWPLTNDGRKATPSGLRLRSFVKGWGETKEKRSFEDRHASTQAYIDYMRPRCVAPPDWHATHRSRT